MPCMSSGALLFCIRSLAVHFFVAAFVVSNRGAGRKFGSVDNPLLTGERKNKPLIGTNLKVADNIVVDS